MAYTHNNWSRKQSSPPPKPKKVRKREPLATEEQKQSMQIADLSYDFAKRIVYLHQYCNDNLKPGNSDNQIFSRPDYQIIEVLAKQLLRSGTSVGANVRESNHAQSAPDFLSKMQIALKEADETQYWLSLLRAGDYLTDEQFNSINHDCTRIIKVLTSIVGTTAKKIKASKEK